MELQGRDVADYLTGPDSIRDGAVERVFIQYIWGEPIVEIVFRCRGQDADERVLILRLQEVLEFDYTFEKGNNPSVIEFVKCLITDGGDFYLSLDPHDERETFVSDRDTQYFRAKTARMVV